MQNNILGALAIKGVGWWVSAQAVWIPKPLSEVSSPWKGKSIYFLCLHTKTKKSSDLNVILVKSDITVPFLHDLRQVCLQRWDSWKILCDTSINIHIPTCTQWGRDQVQRRRARTDRNQFWATEALPHGHLGGQRVEQKYPLPIFKIEWKYIQTSGYKFICSEGVCDTLWQIRSQLVLTSQVSPTHLLLSVKRAWLVLT